MSTTFQIPEGKSVVERETVSRSLMNSIAGQIAIAVLGIAIGQALLYGPSLAGTKILLPLSLLAVPGSYLPLTDRYRDVVPDNVTLADLVFYMEPERQFANKEIRAGRLPLWTPYRFAGAPLYTLGFSPPWLLAYLVASPVVLAWTQMLVALIAGLGMFYFCRGILGLSVWASLVAAWCYPLTGAYVLWVGHWLPAVMCWLPWSLAAVDRTVRTPTGWGGPALCAVTSVTLIGGSLDIAGQVLLISGLYSAWCILDEYGRRSLSWNGVRAAAALLAGWTLGIACTMWLLMPLAAYVSNGSRMMMRSDGVEERPPVGLSELPQVILPDIYGSAENGSIRIGATVLSESSAAAYAGSIACLVFAPLAWFKRRHRSAIGMLTFLSLFSLSWSLNLPGMVQLLRLPGMNMMSHNRLVFVSGFAFVVLAAIGLDCLLSKEVARRWWFGIPALIFVGLCAWCIFRFFELPEPVASQLGATFETSAEIGAVQLSFRRAYAFNAVFCVLGAALWGVLLLRSRIPRWLAPAAVLLLFVQLVHFGLDRASQSDPALYFPRLPILERIAASPEGRVIGFNTFPANLGQLTGLADIRGYDGIDPHRMVQLLLTVRIPPAVEVPYALTQFLSPFLFEDPETRSLRLPPVLDMLNVRYVIFRGAPPPEVHPFYIDQDYWVFSNKLALSRAFVPKRVEEIPDSQARLQALSRVDFDAHKIAYVEEPVKLTHEIAGTVSVVEDTHRSVTLSATMETAGLVVLSYRWERGWRAYVNDAPVPILRVNHALRGVKVAPGVSTIRFVYAPTYLYRGLAVSIAGAIGWLVWVGTLAFRSLRPS